MNVNNVLQQLKFGNSVAEDDKDLESYFVETETFRMLVADDADLILGDKGTGKSALYQILKDRYHRDIPNVEVITAFNPTGDPVFQRLLGKELNEAQYIGVWKTYVLSLAGNWLLQHVPAEDYTANMVKIDGLLRQLQIRSSDFEIEKLFGKIVGRIKTLIPKKAGVDVGFNPTGQIESAFPHIELGASEPTEEHPFDRHTEALRLLNQAFGDRGLSAWLVLDRLDEAFQGEPETEIPALRALLRTYLDLKEFNRLRLKIFVRKDLFRKVSGQEFVNLTHVGAKAIEVIWDDQDLLNLLVRRVRANEDFVRIMQLENKEDKEIFYSLFPDQVDAGDRKAKTWNWMLTRFGDGVSRPPRNLIDLVNYAKQEQQRRENRAPNELVEGEPLIRSEAIKAALARLSKTRVSDTLLAESGSYRVHIEKFRGGKSEHNLASIMETLEINEDQTKKHIAVLKQLGFLEQKGESYKIPTLYREGLEIKQGKAF